MPCPCQGTTESSTTTSGGVDPNARSSRSRSSRFGERHPSQRTTSGSSAYQTLMPNNDNAAHASRASGTEMPTKRADSATSSAADKMLNGWRRTAAQASATIISKLLCVQTQRIDLHQGDSLLGEADRDRRLTNRQAAQFVRTDEERLATAQQPTRDGSSRSKLDLPNDLRTATCSKRSGHRVG